MADIADRYESAYAEKLWSLIPAFYRDIDGTSEPPGTLRALIEVIAEQAAILRRSQDRVWEDQFVERADDWAVPYLGDLVATRVVSALLPRERRIDVAKTVYYRRRAGTLRVLEELISDIARWEGAVTESFRRLIRMPHGLDPSAPARGRWSNTPPGALADLRHPLAAQLTGTAWEEYHRTPDLRAPRGRDGQYGIPRLVFHLYRAQALPIAGVTPRRFAAGPDVFFTFDPSGRDVPLFARRSRTQALSDDTVTRPSALFQQVELEGSAWEAWTSARAWQVPAPMRCRLLADVAYVFDPQALAPLTATLSASERAALGRLYGLRIGGERRLSVRLAASTPPLTAAEPEIRRIALAADCGKAALLDLDDGSLRILPDVAGSGPPLPVDALQADDLSTASVSWASWQSAAIDCERGRFVLEPGVATPDLLTDHVIGTPGAPGALPQSRTEIPWADPEFLASLPLPATLVNGGGGLPALGSPAGILEIADNRTYSSASDHTNIDRLLVRASDGRRPYLRLAADWTFSAAGAGVARVTLDGLWIGAEGAARAVVFDGEWELVEIRGCTLDPGGVAADGGTLAPVSIRIEGSVERLVIGSSIAASVEVGGGVLGTLEVRDSILQAARPIDLDRGELHVVRSTVLGEVRALRLWASDSVFAADVRAIDVQNGCFRFSAAPRASLDRVPHPYQSVFFRDAGALFASTRFGDADYATLSAAPELGLVASPDDLDGSVSIHTGASNDSEMGAHNALLRPIKQRALRTKVEEFLPFGLLPVFVRES